MKINKLVFVISFAVLAGCAQKQAKDNDAAAAAPQAQEVDKGKAAGVQTTVAPAPGGKFPKSQPSATTVAPAPTSPVPVRGTVQKLDKNVLSVKARDGSAVSIKLADDFVVLGITNAKLADVAAGKFIGTTTLGERNGALVALEVHVFPENMRGTAEGHFPWDLKPDSKMTNANVANVTRVGKDRVLTVQYKGGEQKVLVPASAKIVTYVPVKRSALKRGAHIFAVAQRQPDGSLTAARVSVGLKGITPPM
jgi:hypothetical protein